MFSRRTVMLPAAVIALSAAAVIWGLRGQAHAQANGGGTSAHRVATIDLMGLTQALLTTDAYAPEREEFGQQYAGRIQDLQTDLESLRNEIQVMQPNDPQRQQLAQQFQQGYQQLQQVAQEAQNEFDSFAAQQAADAYAEVRAEATSIAEERGYSHVIASRPGNEIEQRQSLATVTQEMLARPVVLSPESANLTQAVRDSMDLPEIEEGLSPQGLSLQQATQEGGEDEAEGDQPAEGEGGPQPERQMPGGGG